MDAAGTAIRAALVDDHSIIRQGLRALLTGQGIEVVGEAENGARAIELARQAQPDVMLLDIRMKDVDGLQALPQIKAVSPQTSVIILTIYANPAYLARAISSGASGYLSKEADPDQIVRAVRAAAAGDAVIDRNLLQAALTASLEQAAALPEDEPEIDPLSERERDVLGLIVRGCANHQIAEMLSISLPTVKTHVQHILQKLHVSDRTQAALLAVRLHLVEMA